MLISISLYFQYISTWSYYKISNNFKNNIIWTGYFLAVAQSETFLDEVESFMKTEKI